ncbi:hypothetical protein ABE288_07690 [Bacillus salipaludis]|uniref:hypothetical protein n=1 Tax=Bacillus salipaludis TaxID=2547811 RepID=UPI003D192838
MKKFFKNGLKVALMGILSFSLLSSTSFAATTTTNDSSKTVITSTCNAQSKEDKNNVEGKERDNYINEALKDEQIKTNIKAIAKEGYKLDKKNIAVKEIVSDTGVTEINVAFLALKSDKEYRIVEWTNLGQTRMVDVNANTGEVNMDYQLPGTVQPQLVYCWACSAVCIGLIEAPPAFLSCVAMCTVFCA